MKSFTQCLFMAWHDCSQMYSENGTQPIDFFCVFCPRCERLARRTRVFPDSGFPKWFPLGSTAAYLYQAFQRFEKWLYQATVRTAQKYRETTSLRIHSWTLPSNISSKNLLTQKKNCVVMNAKCLTLLLLLILRQQIKPYVLQSFYSSMKILFIFYPLVACVSNLPSLQLAEWSVCLMAAGKSKRLTELCTRQLHI